MFQNKPIWMLLRIKVRGMVVLAGGCKHRPLIVSLLVQFANQVSFAIVVFAHQF